MKLAIAAFALASALDAATFGFVTTPANVAGEANPVARALFVSGGLLAVWAIKTAAATLIAAAGLVLARRRPRLSFALLGVFAVLSIAAATSNVVLA